jgi:uncharacterized protein
MSKTSGYTALCTAVADGDLARLRRLAANDPPAAGHWKPVMDAALAGRADMIEVLIGAGANPNVVAGTPGRHTPLIRALQHHETIAKGEPHARVVELLLQHGADANLAAGPHAMVPLAYAAVAGNRRCIDLLLQHGADLDVHLYAALYDRAELERQARNETEVNERDTRGRTPLHYLAFSGLWRNPEVGSEAALACARLLLDRGADVDPVENVGDDEDNFRATPLWRAVGWQKHAPLARLLLDAGADPNNAVFAAAFEGSIALMELLDRYGANWELTHEGETPLIELMYYKRPAAVPWLLARGVDVNARGKGKRTALHCAAMQGVKDTYVAALLQAGARRGLKDASGKTALDWAKEKSRSKLVALLA